MDFIERIFGISPDGGSGLLELLLFLIPIVGTLMLLPRRRYPRATRGGKAAFLEHAPRCRVDDEN